MLFAHFRSPLVLILVFAALVSGVVSEWLDAVIIVAIVIGSAVLGFFQEYRASNAVAELRARVQLQVRVRREGVINQVPATELVPGYLVILSTGGLVPADGRVRTAGEIDMVHVALAHHRRTTPGPRLCRNQPTDSTETMVASGEALSVVIKPLVVPLSWAGLPQTKRR